MTRWAVRFGYDGSRFHGWAQQPGVRTVEGDILSGLVRHGVSPPTTLTSIAVASRTDRGVSARANVLVVESTLEPPALLRALNGIGPELFFTAAVNVPPEFRVRRAVRRTYRYFLRPNQPHLATWRRAARLFQGPVDVRTFGRGIGSESPVFRSVERVRVVPRKDGGWVEVSAPFFVWGMVRKIVGTLGQAGEGRLSLARLESAIRGTERLTVPLAPPEPLVLWDVEYPFRWTFRSSRPSRHQALWWVTERERLSTHSRVLQALEQAAAPAAPHVRVAPGGTRRRRLNRGD